MPLGNEVAMWYNGLPLQEKDALWAHFQNRVRAGAPLAFHEVVQEAYEVRAPRGGDVAIPAQAQQAAAQPVFGQVIYYDAEQLQQLQFAGYNFGPKAEAEEPDNMPVDWKCLNVFKVGADPEFVAVQPGGALELASNHIPHAGPVGYDHNGAVAEVRPAASRSTLRLIQNMAALLNDPLKMRGLEKFRLKAGAVFKHPARALGRGNIESLGGHVHLDIKFEQPGAWTPKYRTRLLALDRLTFQLEELDILPRVESRERRAAGNYGAFSDTRPAGTKPRLEYRSPASWLHRPEAAFCCLTGYKLAAYSPEAALDLLPKEPDARALKNFFERFRAEDDDCALLMERFLSGGVKKVQGDPSEDFREAWRDLGWAAAKSVKIHRARREEVID